MDSVFEDDFMDIQSEMVQFGLDLAEKVNGNVDKIYLLIFSKPISFSASIFFKIGNQILEWNRIEIVGGFDSYKKLYFKPTYEQSIQMRKLFKANGRPCPGELRLTYDLETEEFEAEYGYDVPEGIYIEDLCTVWLDELRAKLPTTQPHSEEAAVAPQISEPEEPTPPKKPGFRFPFFWKK